MQRERREHDQRLLSPGGVVLLGDAAGLDEAEIKICRQAEAWVPGWQPGKRLRVQRSQGNRPAVEAGFIHCP